jgi:hypothetical protein
LRGTRLHDKTVFKKKANAFLSAALLKVFSYLFSNTAFQKSHQSKQINKFDAKQ